ncbi:MAG TPA: 4Fe-4S dicluster domain-containing protein, partial [Aquaticitalea sp.]|nr:4Fe-4S dicluster domain-containing protein [Aquaticitalea sp.]
LNAAGKEIVLLTQTFASPSTSKLIAAFKEKYGNVRHVVYDAISASTALDAFEAKYGQRALANYDFSKAATIVSVGADFLGDWQGGGFDGGYAQGRIPKDGKMSRHIQIEANMSLTGANADKRIPATPAEQRKALAKIYSYITGQAVSVDLPSHIDEAIQNVASELKKAGSKGVLVTGIDDVNAQTLALEINTALGSKAFDTKAAITTRQGNDKTVAALVADMKAGKVGGIILCGVNPVYTLPNASDFAEALKNPSLELSIAFSLKADETALLVQYIAAAPHYLESWGDVELKKGHYALTQPTIRPLFDTRQFQDALLKWTDNDLSYHDFIKETWNGSVLGGSSFNKALHDGVFSASGLSMAALVGEEMDSNSQTGISTETETFSGGSAARTLAASSSEGFELVLYSKVGMGDGQQANNPWLQEFPDPITRVSWDNYLTISKTDAEKIGAKNWHVADGGLNSSLVELTINGVKEVLPVIIQPGQATGSIGLSFGYGRQEGLKGEMRTGKNGYKFYQNFNSVQSGASLKTVSGVHEFACVQLHNTLMGRGDIIKETTLEIFNTKDKSHWNAIPVVSLNHVETPVTSPDVDIWDEFDRSIGHHFNLSIDLNACTGCGACVIACHAENNVPVVGKEEVRKSRDMHWLRIDRYYSSESTFEQDNKKKDGFSGLFGDKGSLGGFNQMETAAMDNPQVAFQPVMCQHCNHAPCETVCPVAATSHGRQGQNHMAYNRCVGTRYCANNCPYKVRRFNWFLYSQNDEFDYHMNDDLGRMVLNPDVVVRSRGVMEKCSFCIQMTQKTILDAKRDGREITDGEFQTACSSACGSGAMVFGDINDKESEVAKLKQDNRMYHLLEHVGTKPNVIYQTKVRNTTEA